MTNLSINEIFIMDNKFWNLWNFENFSFELTNVDDWNMIPLSIKESESYKSAEY